MGSSPKYLLLLLLLQLQLQLLLLLYFFRLLRLFFIEKVYLGDIKYKVGNIYIQIYERKFYMTKVKQKKVTLSLDEETLKVLSQLAKDCGYGSMSASIRILVKKYGNKELSEIRG